MGRPGHVHRRGAEFIQFGFSAVLPRRGARDGRAAAVRDRRAHPRGAGLPHHPDLRRGQALVFFDRFYREVFGATPTTSATSSTSSARTSTRTGRSCSTASSTTAPRTCARTRATSPGLVRGVTVYMIVIEGTLALTGARFIISSPEGERLVPRVPRRLHRRQPRRVAPRRLRGQVPRRRDQGRPGATRRIVEDTLKESLPVGALVFVAAVGRRPVRLRDAVLPLVARSSSTRRSRSRRSSRRWGSTRRCSPSRRLSEPAAAAPRRPRAGPRPGARERILEAGLEVMKADGYAGLTIAKVAARAGESKALIAYHFGSKQGLVAAVARRRSPRRSPTRCSARLGEATRRRGAGRAAPPPGVERVLDRDERLGARLLRPGGGLGRRARGAPHDRRDQRGLARGARRAASARTASPRQGAGADGAGDRRRPGPGARADRARQDRRSCAKRRSCSPWRSRVSGGG